MNLFRVYKVRSHKLSRYYTWCFRYFCVFFLPISPVFLYQCHADRRPKTVNLNLTKKETEAQILVTFLKISMCWQQKQNKNKLLDFWTCNHLYRKHFLKNQRGSAWPQISDHIKAALRSIFFWQPSMSWAPGGHVGGQTASSLSLCEYASCAPICHREWFLFARRMFKRGLKHKFCV